MHFQHSSEIWTAFPELVPGVIVAEGMHSDHSVLPQVAGYYRIAEERLGTGSESDLPEIQAWRRAFSRMGLKLTQYRCASESLLRRFRKEGTLPHLHPLIDLCNAISLAFAVPIAVFDVSRLTGSLEVRHATGTETFGSFSGETEHPNAGEVIFVDDAGEAHARRWCHRQSASSAVRDTTTVVLIVTEAMHESAGIDIPRLLDTLGAEVERGWSITATTSLLSPSSPSATF